MQQAKSVILKQRRAKLDAWLASHRGVVPLRVMVGFGFSRSTVYRMVERGELAPILPGILRTPQAPQDREQLMVALCARNGDAVISSLTAAALWEFRKVPKDRRIHVMVPHSSSASFDDLGDRIVVHRCRQIDPVDIVTRADGIRVLSPSRTLLDIADIVREPVIGSILEQLLDRKMGTMTTHLATLMRLGHPQRPGARTMARAIGDRPTWRAAMQSDLEVRVLAEIERQGLPAPEVQHRLTLPNGDVITLDFAWPQFKEALEVDHPFWHAGAESSHRDKRRDRKAATVGWHTTRMTDVDVDAGLAEAVHDIATIIDLATHAC
jgi:hypothetical protein